MCDSAPWQSRSLSLCYILLEEITVLCNLEQVNIFAVSLNFYSLLDTEMATLVFVSPSALPWIATAVT